MTDFLVTVMDQPHLTEKWPAFIEFSMTTKECIRKKCMQSGGQKHNAGRHEQQKNAQKHRQHKNAQQLTTAILSTIESIFDFSLRLNTAGGDLRYNTVTVIVATL